MNCKDIYVRDMIENSLKSLYTIYKGLDYTSLEDLRKELSILQGLISDQQYKIKKGEIQ